ncbi:MAG: radical SAM protein [Candidatus Omnitrophota bacterium]|jgi:radical SAM superfamily enzyme YgiQ (UPF0313 family)
MSDLKVLLVDPFDFSKHAWYRKSSYPVPLGLMYLQAYLKQNGYPRTFLRRFSAFDKKEVFSALSDLKPDIVGISSLTADRIQALAITSLIKQYNPLIKVILGGYHPTFMYRQLMENYPFIDYIVRGEGELTLLKLLETLKCGEATNKIPGLVCRDSRGKVLEGVPGEIIQDLDSLPFPCYDDIPITLLRKANYFSVMASRGCVFKCSYCSGANFHGYRTRSRRVDNIIEELKYLKYRFNARAIYFSDAAFGSDPALADEFCEKILKEDLKMSFAFQTRAEYVNYGILKKLKMAGLRGITFGMESGSLNILKNAGRNPSLEILKKAVNYSKKLEIKTRINIIIGWPEETKNDINDTMGIIHDMRPNQIRIYTLVIFPGTNIYEQAKAEGIINDGFWLTPWPAPKYIYRKEGRKGLLRVQRRLIRLTLNFCLRTSSISDIISVLKSILIMHIQTVLSSLRQHLIQKEIRKMM